MRLTHTPVLLSKESGIATITMNQPESLNVLSVAMLDALEAAFLDIGRDYEVRCVIVTGIGRAFSAGADLREMREMPSAAAYRYSTRGQAVLAILESLEVPSIAQINGIALGGGCELALAATFRIASSDAVIGLPELSLGLIPGFGGTQRLPRLVGMQAARRLILGSEKVEAEVAHRIGLLDLVVEPLKLANVAIEFAQKLSLAPGPALKAAARSMEAAVGGEASLGFEVEAQNFSEVFASEERNEGLTAFFEKRTPHFHP